MRLLYLASLAALLSATGVLAWLVRAAPLEPGWAGGLLRADGLSAMIGAASAALALAEAAVEPRRAGRLTLAAAVLVAAYLTTHLAALAALLLLAAMVLGGRRWTALLPALLSGTGLVLCAVRAGTWRYSVPTAGVGLNSVSLALILLAALLAGGAWALPAARPATPPAVDPLLGAAALYPLYRLFSLGPWNLGWLFAALLLGGSAALWAAWRAATGPDPHVRSWLSAYTLALAVAGAGLSSGAGLALGAFALLSLAPLRLGLAPDDDATTRGRREDGTRGDNATRGNAAPLRRRFGVGASRRRIAGSARRRFGVGASARRRGAGSPDGPSPLWLLSGAVPLSAPFVVAWAGVAGALAGGLSLLAAALWAAALLAALPVARMAGGQETRRHGDTETRRHGDTETRRQQYTHGSAAVSRSPGLFVSVSAHRRWLAGGISLAIGVGAPALSVLLVEPAVAQLQAGLTPLGELVLWPWAGLLALNAARQPVATLPSLALAALMLVLAALAWTVARLLALWRGRP